MNFWNKLFEPKRSGTTAQPQPKVNPQEATIKPPIAPPQPTPAPKRLLKDEPLRPLVPSDVVLGWPQTLTAQGIPAPNDWDFHFGIFQPTGAFIGFSHGTEEGARICVEEIKKFVQTHTVSPDQVSINKMMVEVDQLILRRINKLS